MLFVFGEKVKVSREPLGDKSCKVCGSMQGFTACTESLWFSLFGLALLRIEQLADYWCCQRCDSAYVPGDLEQPSQVPIVKRVIVYLLNGYGHADQSAMASEVCLKLSGCELSREEFRAISGDLRSARLDMVEQIRQATTHLNNHGKQQVIQAAFLTTYLCCDLQYEDRLRINLMGNALGVGLEFVEYAVQETRRQNYYGVHRLGQRESEV